MYDEIIASHNGNTCFSPISVAMVMSMLYAGAEGETKSQIADAMDYGEVSESTVHSSFKALDESLVANDEMELSLANRLYGANGLNVEATYQNTIRTNYGGEMERLDFAGAPEPSRLHINEWVSTETQTKIPELLGEGTIDQNTVMVVVNAVYFKGTWKTEFDEEETQDETFNGFDENNAPVTATVPMMSAREDFKYVHSDDLNAEIIELPYDGEEVSMIVMLPNDDIGALEPGINVAEAISQVTSVDAQTVNFKMPRFEIEQEMFLRSILQEMGVSDMFDETAADLSGGYKYTTIGSSVGVPSQYITVYIQHCMLL